MANSKRLQCGSDQTKWLLMQQRLNLSYFEHMAKGSIIICVSSRSITTNLVCLKTPPSFTKFKEFIMTEAQKVLNYLVYCLMNLCPLSVRKYQNHCFASTESRISSIRNLYSHVLCNDTFSYKLLPQCVQLC
jgi:hypothetical protein